MLITELIKMAQGSWLFDRKNVSCGSNNRISFPETADNKMLSVCNKHKQINKGKRK